MALGKVVRLNFSDILESKGTFKRVLLLQWKLITSIISKQIIHMSIVKRGQYVTWRQVVVLKIIVISPCL